MEGAKPLGILYLFIFGAIGLYAGIKSIVINNIALFMASIMLITIGLILGAISYLVSGED